ncbi:MAG: hypothetical protein ACW99F_01630 [Candidatus Hodarchaeales archaeon]
MEKIYRFILAGFLVIIAIAGLILNTVLRSSEPSTSSSSGEPYTILMIVIAGLVIVVFPSIFILVRLVRR